MFAGASCKACSICNPSRRTATKLCMGASIQALTGDHKYHKCTPPCHGETHRWKFTASCLRTRSWLNTHVHTLGRLQEFASTRAASSLLGPADPDGCYARGGDCQPLRMQCVPSHLVAALVATPGCLTGLAALAGNCGATEGLLTCSRCRSAWFCSVKCQRVRQVASGAPLLLLTAPAALHHSLAGTQAYWPFHKASCQRNEFADVAEAAEPKFAAWMRRHGKLAVLQDDEVLRHALPQHPPPRQHLPQGWLVRRAPEQRRPAAQVDLLERASAATTGRTRAEVMDSMYNRLEPKPAGAGSALGGSHPFQDGLLVLITHRCCPQLRRTARRRCARCGRRRSGCRPGCAGQGQG